LKWKAKSQIAHLHSLQPRLKPKIAKELFFCQCSNEKKYLAELNFTKELNK